MYTILIMKIANHFGQFILVTVKKNLRKSQAQFWDKLRKLRLRQNYGFLIKKKRESRNDIEMINIIMYHRTV